MCFFNKIKASYLGLGLTLLLSGLTFTSCSKENEAVFDESASQRVDEAIIALRTKLSSAEHGWIMEYYPNKFQAYGGYVIGMKFDAEGNVLISSQHKQTVGKDITSSRSNYELGKDRSVTLNFVTYNEHIHYFADPAESIGQGQGKGLEGDHEFLVMESESPDVVILKGKKTKNTIKMYKATEPISSYLTKVVSLNDGAYTTLGLNKNHMEALTGTLDGKKVDLIPAQDGFSYYTLKLVDEPTSKLNNSKVPYVVTPEGLRFYTPLEGIEGLTWNAGDKSFTTDKGDKLIARIDPIYPKYTAYLGAYTFQYNTNQTLDVVFTEGLRNEYLITGFPFKLKAIYDVAHDRFEIRVQKLGYGDAMFCVWDPEEGTLSWNEKLGMYGKEIAGSSPKTYEMIDNGAWGSSVAKNYILWSPTNREYKAFSPFPSRFQSPKFIRKN